jgi:hypothetical protein
MARGSLEKTVEGAVDGFFSRIFRGEVKPLHIGRRLIHLIDGERGIDANGRRVVPNTYVVELSAADREGFAREELEMSLLQELTVAVREYIAQEGYVVEGKPRVSLRTEPDLRKGRFRVEARHTRQEPSIAALPPLPKVAVTTPPGGERPPSVLTLPGGQRVELRDGEYVIGRHLQSDIVIDDSNVSRRHARLVCARGGVLINDMGSTNGTKINGVLVSGDQLLQHGDVVNLGTVQLRFEAT